MSKISRRNGNNSRLGTTTKYDAHHTVLAKTYGPLADLRRELADSKTAVAARADTLRLFADCGDSQRAWLLLEDYFEKLSLSRKDFPKQFLALLGGRRMMIVISRERSDDGGAQFVGFRMRQF